AQLYGGALVAVEVNEGGRVSVALAPEVVALVGRRVDDGDERVDSLHGVVGEEPPLGDDVVAAAFAAAEEFDEVEALAVEARVGVNAVVGDDDERGVGGLRRLPDGRPDAADEGVQLLQDGEVNGVVAVVVRGVVEVRQVEVEVADGRVAELRHQLALLLLVYDVAPADAGLPLVEKLSG